MLAKSEIWISGFLLLLLCACEELERNNPLDPKNPGSERRQVVLVEAFVNDGTPFSPFALTALDSLAAAFPQEQVVIVEHHLPSASFPDAQALQESAVRYNSYATSSEHGVPDVFFNGSRVRVQGASSARTALLRYRSAIQTELGKSAHFTIEAKKNISTAGINIDVTIARLGSESLSQFAVTTIIWEDLDAAGHHHVVRKVLSENLSSINAGEKKNVRLTTSLSSTINMSRLQVAVLIEQTSGLGKEVLQVALVE